MFVIIKIMINGKNGLKPQKICMNSPGLKAGVTKNEQ